MSSSLDGDHVALKYPKFDYGLTRRIGQGAGSEVGLNSSVQYSASFDITPQKQDYDLQDIISGLQFTILSLDYTVDSLGVEINSLEATVQNLEDFIEYKYS